MVFVSLKKVIKLANNLIAVTAQRMENENFSDSVFAAALVSIYTHRLATVFFAVIGVALFVYSFVCN